MCVFDLIFVNYDGDIVEGEGLFNVVVFVIYLCIYKNLLYVIVVVYIYLFYGKVWFVFGCLLDLIIQDVCVFYDDYVFFNDYIGVVLDILEGDRIFEVFGEKKVVIF